MSCDRCKNKIEILASRCTLHAFLEAEETEWISNDANTKHVCPECISKVLGLQKHNKDTNNG